MNTVIEVAIGLALAFFVVALVASAVVELGATLLKTRSETLRKTISEMVGSPDLETKLRQTSVYKTLALASSGGRKNADDSPKRAPDHLPARAFADAVIEVLSKEKKRVADAADSTQALLTALGNGPLGERLLAVSAEVGEDLTALKAGIEAWFDDTMERLHAAYTRNSRWFLLLVGLIFAGGMNISATQMTTRLWNDTAVRTAVADSAAAVVADPDADEPLKDLDEIATKVDEIKELGLPIGWGEDTRPDGMQAWVLTIAGWIVVGAMAMFGAPFWFEALTRLSSFRGKGSRPPAASDDPLSATTLNVMGWTVERQQATASTTTPAQRLFAAIPTAQNPASQPPST